MHFLNIVFLLKNKIILFYKIFFIIERKIINHTILIAEATSKNVTLIRLLFYINYHEEHASF